MVSTFTSWISCPLLSFWFCYDFDDFFTVDCQIKWLKYMSKIRRYKHSNKMVFINQIKNTLGALSLKNIKNEHVFLLFYEIQLGSLWLGKRKNNWFKVLDDFILITPVVLCMGTVESFRKFNTYEVTTVGFTLLN